MQETGTIACKLSMLAPDWWDYTTLDDDILKDAAKLTLKDIEQMGYDTPKQLRQKNSIGKQDEANSGHCFSFLTKPDRQILRVFSASLHDMSFHRWHFMACPEIIVDAGPAF
jgi:hypothetical protein